MDINKKNVNLSLEKWKNLENYFYQEKSIRKLFENVYPLNNTIENVLIKVASLNDFYSTNIFNVYAVSKHILKLNIDDRLKFGDENLVEDISKVIIGNNQKNFYSFATKYCHHHNQGQYPIYDKYVVRALMKLKRSDKFAKFIKNDLKNYSFFKKIIQEFKSFYNLQDCTFSEVDKYLWQLGKGLI